VAFSWSNTCEGSSGTAVSTANTAGPVQFSAVTVSGTGASLNFSNAQKFSGSTALLATIGSVAGAAYPQWNLASAVTTCYARQFVYLPAAVPASGFRIFAYYDSTGSSHRASVFITSAGVLQTVNAAFAQVALGTHSIPTGQWARVEFDCTGDAAAGVVTTRLYLTANSPTADETLSNTAQATGGTIGQCLFGAFDSEVSWSWYMDSLAISDQGPIGPEATLVSGTDTASGAEPASPVIKGFPSTARQWIYR
jgi:hypothetical protein